MMRLALVARSGMALFARVAFLLLLLCAASLARACGVTAALPSGVRVWRVAAGDEPSVVIRFLGHASFLIVTPGNVSAVTDYSGAHEPPAPPDVVTMNHAHSTHFTLSPDPRIGTVLHGWRDDGRPAEIDAKIGDLHIRNLPTNIRNWDGTTEKYGNSIFVFEAAGLCIAHLGHLHHLLTEDDIAVLGPIDIVMAPIDGMWTLNQGDITDVLGQLNAKLVLPMHYFSQEMLERFLRRVRGRYAIRTEPSGSLTVARSTLPRAPEILILPGPYF